MPDLTIVFLTANEHPPQWVQYHRRILLNAAREYPVIESSPRANERRSHLTMYRQLLRASKRATTPYIAVAESDTLYHEEHFNFFRPPDDAVAYDMSRWLLLTWNPVFSLKRRICNSTLIAPREYLIESLEERCKEGIAEHRVAEVGRNIHESALGITLRRAIEVWCDVPTIQLGHPNNISYQQAHHPTRKSLGELKATEIPFWNRAEDIVSHYV